MVAIFVCPYSWSLFVGATSSSERQEVFRMQQSGRVHPGPVGLAHEVQLLPQLECSRQMQPPPAPPAHEQLMSGLLLEWQNSRWDPHGCRVSSIQLLSARGQFLFIAWIDSHYKAAARAAGTGIKRSSRRRQTTEPALLALHRKTWPPRPPIDSG